MVSLRYNLQFKLITDYSLSLQRVLAAIAQDTAHGSPAVLPLLFLQRLLDKSLISVFVLARDHSTLRACSVRSEHGGDDIQTMTQIFLVIVSFFPSSPRVCSDFPDRVAGAFSKLDSANARTLPRSKL